MEYMKFMAILILRIVPYTLRSSVEAQRISEKAVKDSSDNNIFPKDFLFGVSTSAPQYEGAWDANGKICNEDKRKIWNFLSKNEPLLLPVKDIFLYFTIILLTYTENVPHVFIKMQGWESYF